MTAVVAPRLAKPRPDRSRVVRGARILTIVGLLAMAIAARRQLVTGNGRRPVLW